MAKQSGLGQRFYFGGRSIGGDVAAIQECSCPRQLLDVTGLDQSARMRVNGLADGQIIFNTWFNDAANQEHIALRGLPTADVLAAYVDGAAVGDPAAMLTAKQLDYDWTRTADGAIKGKVTLKGNGNALEWGESLTAGQITHASATSSASKDDAAATTRGIVGQLQVLSIASGTPTFVIQESSDDAVGDPFTAKLTFTAVAAASAPTAERVTASGNVERYLRATTTGTFTTAVFAIHYRRGTTQDDVTL